MTPFIPMSLAQIAENDKFKTDLSEALANPVIQITLLALQKDCAPSSIIKMNVPGMDAMHAVALDYAAKSGAWNIIERLKNVPALTSKRLRRGQPLGQPWAYLGEEEEESGQESTAKSKPKPKPSAS